MCGGDGRVFIDCSSQSPIPPNNRTKSTEVNLGVPSVNNAV